MEFIMDDYTLNATYLVPYMPPTAAEWEALRPLVIDLYVTRQKTARQIVEELRQHGFLVTEKMLRDRLRQYGVRKNQLKNRSSDNVVSPCQGAGPSAGYGD
ncbi:uncharacterized protein LTR77_009877 [Saxophila tyrrhenica]|uniref:Clr5 domain-containing protein n=1 Tax=Saxophila tyrrhenica TaxID=1690608 RepID=A0AAV9NYF2_9PEZI|nr:hypothetical protein LTR77_009877 [Saxophila tyrrhenica]